MNCPHFNPARSTTKIRYELRIASVVGPAVLSSFPHTSHALAVRRKTVFRTLMQGNRDKGELIGILRAHDLQILEIRQHEV
ncbi:MAG: hypothetical protein ACJ74U_02560 [Jatrophihabitantaceae bacterium]